MKKKICFALALLLILLLLAGCIRQEKTLLDADTVKITRTGAETTITDKISGETYTLLHRAHKQRSEATQEPYTAIDTPTMRITILPGGFRVESGNTTYTLVTHRRFTHG